MKLWDQKVFPILLGRPPQHAPLALLAAVNFAALREECVVLQLPGALPPPIIAEAFEVL